MNEKAYNVKKFWDNFRKAVVDFGIKENRAVWYERRVIGDGVLWYFGDVLK